MEKLKYEGRTIYHDAKGYACVWADGQDRKIHILEWEKVNGPKPNGHDIHHLDEDKGNWSLSNLQLLTHSDHQRVHAGWVMVDGEWKEKPCTSCGGIFALADFYQRKGYTPSAKCKKCHLEMTKDWAKRNPEKRKEISLAHYYRKKEVESNEL